MRMPDTLEGMRMFAKDDDFLTREDLDDAESKAAFARCKSRLMGEVRARLQAQRELQSSVAEATQHPPLTRLPRWKRALALLAPSLFDQELREDVDRLVEILPDEPGELPCFDRLKVLVPVMDKGGIMLEAIARLFETPRAPWSTSERALESMSVLSDSESTTRARRTPSPSDRAVAEIRRHLEDDCPHLLWEAD